MRWTKAGKMDGGKIMWSGIESMKEAGVGFLLTNRARDALMGSKQVSDRIIAAVFMTGGRHICTRRRII